MGFLCLQVGVERGGGGVGGRNYRGRGLGNLLGGLGRTLIPLLKSGEKALLKEGARTGMQLAQDVLSGQHLKSALQHRGKQAGKRLTITATSSQRSNRRCNTSSFSFSFSSRWHRSAWKGPYALRPVSQQSPQGCP